MQALSTLDLLKDSSAQRRTMVDCQIRTFDVTDQRLIARFLEVPRELFLPAHVKALAYSDIGFVVPAASSDKEARYLLPPLVLARLIQGGRVRGADRALDVAAGLGYSTAILAGLAANVIALEADPDRSAALRDRLAAAGLDRLRTFDGPLTGGVPSEGPFDVILLNGSVETNPETLIDQLADGGRLLTIKRSPADPTGRAAKAVCFEKRGGDVGMRSLFDASAPIIPGFQKTAGFVF